MLLNLTVLYFAFGAPLGVYGVIRSKGTSPRALAANFVQFLLWPLFAAASVRDAFIFRPPEISLEQQMDAIRAEFEAEIAADLVPQFRDVFARYTGLSLALAGPENENASQALLMVAGRGRSKVATACLARSNHRRLEFHLRFARKDFAYFAGTSSRTFVLKTKLDELLEKTC